MVTNSLERVLWHGLQTAVAAEGSLADILPKLAESADQPEIAEALRQFGKESARHSTCLECELASPRGESNAAGIAGLLNECGNSVAAEEDTVAKDALLLAGAWRIARYQGSAYETLRGLARLLHEDQLEPILASLVDEETKTAQSLKRLADSVIYLPQRELNETS
ncbi:MAG: DUF892 family protein [Acidobacteria bacterium]|nr:DUF892 family protein [Acidobacteriota bacterium]